MSNGIMQVNPNKVVYLTAGGTSWRKLAGDRFEVSNAIHLYPESDFSMSATNEYNDPLEQILETVKKTKFIKKALDAFETADNILSLFNIRLMTRYTGAKAWNGSSQLNFSLSFKFYMGMAGLYSGFEEVFKPIVNLAYWALPRVTSGFTMTGPAESYAIMVATYAKYVLHSFNNLIKDVGNTLQNFFNTDNASGAVDQRAFSGLSNIADQIGAAISNSSTARAVFFGSQNQSNAIASFRNVLPTSFKYSFSREVDSNGWPIAGTVDIECATLLRAVANDLTDGVSRAARGRILDESPLTIGNFRMRRR